MHYKRVIVTGSIAYDHIMSMPTRFSKHIMPDKIHLLNVSFVMKKFSREFGGTGGNIAYNLSLLGVPTILVASAGKDFGRYKKHLSNLNNLDISQVSIHESEMCASGFAMTDQDNNQIWGFYEGAMRFARNKKLTSIFQPEDFLIIAPNDPIAMIRYANQAIDKKIDYLFDPSFNVTKIPTVDLSRCCKKARILIGNDYEIALILRRLGWKLSELLENVDIVITTMGSKGSVISYKNNLYKIKATPPNKSISDPTGAGDAYRAGFVAGFVKNMTPTECGKLGSTTSVYTVEQYGTQTHKFTKKELEKRYYKNFGKKISI